MRRRIKLAVITPTRLPELNGVSVALDDRINWLREFAPHVCVLTIGPKYHDESYCVGEKIFKSLPIPGLKPARMPLANAKCIIETLRGFKPDIVHVEEPERFTVFSRYFIRDIERCFPLVGFLHTDHMSLLGNYGLKLLRPHLESSFRNAYSYCTLIAACFSNRIIENNAVLYGKFRAGKYLGVDSRIFSNRKLIRNDKQCLLLGRVAKDRQIDEFLDRVLPDKRSKAYDIVIVGDGPLLDRLRNCYGDLNVKFIGSTSRVGVSEMLSKSSFCINPCEHEAYGLGMLESVFTHTPVLSVPNALSKKLVDMTQLIQIFDLQKPDTFFESAEKAVGLCIESNSLIDAYSMTSCMQNLFQVYQEAMHIHKSKSR